MDLRRLTIEIPSLTRSPAAAVRFSRSEPARSTKWNLDVSVDQLSTPAPFSNGLVPRLGSPRTLPGRRLVRLPKWSPLGVIERGDPGRGEWARESRELRGEAGTEVGVPVPV